MTTLLKARFLSKSQSDLTELRSVPVVTNINLNKSLFDFTDSWDFIMEFKKFKEADSIKSHDFVEYYFDTDGRQHQAAVGFLEDFSKDTTPNSIQLSVNGRDLNGQLMQVPFRTQLFSKRLPWLTFIKTAIKGSYLEIYQKFRRQALIIDQGAYPGDMLFSSDLNTKKADIIQRHAETALNLVYLDRRGSLVLRGQESKIPERFIANRESQGVLKIKAGESNVISMNNRDNFSEVFSEVVVHYSGQQLLDRNSVPSNLIRNQTDKRVAHIDKPQYMAFNQQDLVDFAGTINVQNRLDSVARSILRKSLRNVGATVLNTPEPFHVFPGRTQFYELGQKWTVFHEDAIWKDKENNSIKSKDQIITSIAYVQGVSELTTTIKLSDPETLV